MENGEDEEDQGCDDTGGYSGCVRPKYILWDLIVGHHRYEVQDQEFGMWLLRKTDSLRDCVVEKGECGEVL